MFALLIQENSYNAQLKEQVTALQHTFDADEENEEQIRKQAPQPARPCQVWSIQVLNAMIKDSATPYGKHSDHWTASSQLLDNLQSVNYPQTSYHPEN